MLCWKNYVCVVIYEECMRILEVLHACWPCSVCLCVGRGHGSCMKEIVQLASMLIMLLWFYEINKRYEEFVCCELWCREAVCMCVYVAVHVLGCVLKMC